MAFLHCHSCGWEQDDFWSPEGYNPLEEHRIADLRRDLFKDEIRLAAADELDCEIISGREFVVRELKRIIRSIESMSVPTVEEWETMKADWACPRCWSKR